MNHGEIKTVAFTGSKKLSYTEVIDGVAVKNTYYKGFFILDGKECSANCGEDKPNGMVGKVMFCKKGEKVEGRDEPVFKDSFYLQYFTDAATLRAAKENYDAMVEIEKELA